MTDQTISTEIITEPAETYNSLRSTYLTSHGLMDYIKCPKTHHMKTSGQIPFKTSKSFEIGTAVHTLVLEGAEVFDARYFVVRPEDEPVNEKTGKPYGVATKAYTEWLDSVKGEREVLSASDAAMIMEMAGSVRDHEDARALLEEGQPEGVLRATINGVRVQIRMDWLNPFKGITDLKTISDLDKFEEQFDEYQYDLQFAFYQIVAEEVLGQVLPFYAIVVEKQAPYRTGVFEVYQHRLNRLRPRILQYLTVYAESAKADWWPTRYESIRVIGGEK